MMVILTTALSIAAVFSVLKMQDDDCYLWLLLPVIVTVGLSYTIVRVVAKESFNP